jgi:uncharacterized OsmC-like protein
VKDVTYAINAKSTSHSRTDVTVRNFTVIVDEPENLGGTNAGPNPIELELASLSGCINVTGHLVARQMGFSIQALEMRLEGTLNPARFMGKDSEDRAGYKEIRVHLQIESDASPDILAAWKEAVEERCPVSDNLSKGTVISLDFVD